MFLAGAIGVPLYAHVCASLGTRALISSCAMHEEEEAPVQLATPVDEPAVAACCSTGEAVHDAPASLPAVVEDAASVHDAISGDCCEDVDVTMQVTDSYTATQHALAMLPMAVVGIVAMPTVPIVQPVSIPYFPSDPSPPPLVADIISSTILLI